MPLPNGSRLSLFTLALLAAVTLCPRTASSQGEANQAPPPSEVKPKISGVREALPKVFYLKNKDGDLIEVPDMTLEDFQRLYKLSQGLDSEVPAFALGSTNITGRVEGTSAALDVTIAIEINAPGDAWVRIPLRFGNSVLREPPQHTGEGELFLEFDAAGEGYVCWMRAPAGSKHTLNCKFLAKVQELGAESRISLTAPSAVSGTLTLAVPAPRAIATCSRRGNEEVLTVTADGSGSLIEMHRPASDFQITWRAGSSTPTLTRQLLEATTALTVRLEGKRRVVCEAKIKLKNLRGPLETFVVRLPPGMRLVSLDQPNLQFTALEPEVDPVTQQPVQLVEVRLAAKTNGPIEALLAAEYLRDAIAAEQPLEVGGFEVLDAVKQAGTIDLVVEGEQSAVWTEGANVRRVDDPSLTDPASAAKSLARFEFDAQPFSLKVQTVPKKTRVSVEPTYVVYVDAQQLRLDATLKFKVRGAKIYTLEYDFSGWTIDRVGPENLVQSESLLTAKVTPLAIPIAASALSSASEFELRVQAHRDLAPPIAGLDVTLPRPVGAMLTPGSIFIVPADNIELIARASEQQGLTPDTLPDTLPFPKRQQAPLVYRELVGGAARFVATASVRERMLTVSSQVNVLLGERQAEVDQRLDYQIAFEALRHLDLEVPRSLWDAGRIQVLLDGELLPVSMLPAADKPDDARLAVRVDLLRDHIGPLELTVRYAVLAPPPAEDRARQWSLPLVSPLLDGTRLGASVTASVEHDPALRLVTQDTSWIKTAGSERVGRGASEWTHTGPADQLALQVQHERAGSTGAVAVEQMWIQTWMSTDKRQDRAVFRITTANQRLQIKLPPGAREQDLSVAIDGRRVSEATLDGDDVLTLSLPLALGPEPVSEVIELWYDFSAGRPPLGEMQLMAPQVINGSEARRAYWQLILPDKEHLLVAPPRLTADMNWRWRGAYFGRVSALSQDELERWIGASHQSELPEATNAYLFSSFGSLQQLTLRTQARRTVLLVCSGMALVAGLALLYFPVLRHPAILLFAGVFLVAFALASPELAAIIAQAAVVGLACLVLARLLKTILGPREIAGVVVRTPAPSGIDSRVRDSQPRPEYGSHATTAAGPMAMAGQAAESES
jgi:hypothetical protein